MQHLINRQKLHSQLGKKSLPHLNPFELRRIFNCSSYLGLEEEPSGSRIAQFAFELVCGRSLPQMSDPITPYFVGRARALLAVLIVAIGGVFGYALHQRSTVNRLSTENSQIVSLLKDTRAQMLTLSSKLDAMTA